MFPKKIDKRQMERAMRQMGIKSKELQGVQEVVIKLPDREIVIPGAQVTLVDMPGQRTYQITGREVERKLEVGPSEEDIKLVMEQAGVDCEAATRALKESGGDLAQAIVKLKGE